MKHSISFLKEHIIADMVSRKRDGSGDVVFRLGYFYSHGNDSSKFSQNISKQLDKLDIKHTVIDHGDHWASFKGGATLANSSHFWVKINFS